MGTCTPQTHLGSSRRERMGKRSKPETWQVAGLFSALQSTTEWPQAFLF